MEFKKENRLLSVNEIKPVVTDQLFDAEKMFKIFMPGVDSSDISLSNWYENMNGMKSDFVDLLKAEVNKIK